MTELAKRRRALMAGQKDGKIWLYNNGETSDVVGGWNTTGYKYGSAFAQSVGPSALTMYATSKYNAPGGRTFTSNNILPNYIGKTLHVKGYFKMNGDLTGGRDSCIYALISDSVQNVSNVQNVLTSGAFTGEIHTQTPAFNDLAPNNILNFEISLSITKTGYLSLVFYKGYTGLLYSYIEEVWIE